MSNNIKIIKELKKDGHSIFVYQLSCSDGSSATISNYGCTLMKLLLNDKNGNLRDIVLGFDTIEEYFEEYYQENYPYFGTVIGRYANRIKGGLFKLDNTIVHLTKNKGNNTLHGGAAGFDKKVWDIIDLNNTQYPSITMQYISPDGEEGFPGSITTRFTFSLLPASFQCQIEANTNKATPVNLTYHPYFNLDKNHTSVGKQKAKIYANHWLEQDEEFCLTGKLTPVDSSHYDFRDWQPVIQQWNIEDGYDQTFVTSKNNDSLSIVAEALSSDEALHMQILSTEPVVHFYTGKWIPVVIGKNRETYSPFSGYCFETHGHPNAVNIPAFPDSILRPGEVYKQTTIYKFK